MPPKIDLTGKKFGYWNVIEFAGKTPRRQSKWKCRCICGVTSIVLGQHLTSGHSGSCGCKMPGNVKHGYSRKSCIKREYNIWANMLQRCNNPKNPGYIWYGARGIKVCERWKDFKNFYDDMGVVPEGMSIDRIDNNKGYSPDNCKWSTPKEQHKNKRCNKQYTIGKE